MKKSILNQPGPEERDRATCLQETEELQLRVGAERRDEVREARTFKRRVGHLRRVFGTRVIWETHGKSWLELSTGLSQGEDALG